MKYLKYYETFTNKIIIGVDIDGTINNFFDGYNLLYKRYFPDKEIIPDTDDWYWYKKFDYNGVDGRKWFTEKKAEIFGLSQPYPGAKETIDNIYQFAKSYGFDLKIVTQQPSENAKVEAKKWLNKYGFKYDDIIFAETSKEKWKYSDIMIDDSDKVIGTKPLNKVAIRIIQPYGTLDGDFNIPNIKSLTIDLIKQAASKLKNNTTK